jgi:basic membrane protein A
MKRMKKMLLLALAAVLAISLIACGDSGAKKTEKEAAADAPAAAETEAEKAEETEAKAADTPAEEPSADKDVRVALILEGAISDMSWNATAYEGLKKIEALGAEVKYVENVPAASVEDSIRAFADEKYNVIFLSTNSFMDTGAKVAKDYPEIQFFMINSSVTDTNVRSFAIQDAEQGYLMGALAAMLSESGKVGFIGGLPINPILNGAKGFEQGAKYINPDIEVSSINIGNFDDVNAAKEQAKAFVGSGVDVLAPMANQASLGVMEAAEEEGVKAIGSGLNQETVAPNAAIVAIVKDTSIAYEAAYKAYLEGDMPMEVLPMGAAQGVVYIGDYYQKVDKEIEDKLVEIAEKLGSGEIKINLD